YGVNANVGVADRPFRWAAFPQGHNDVQTFIPVAMISEMLLNPGASYEYDGVSRTFPNIRMVWWAGGNPFHHHQDLNRLRRAFQKPETIIVNEINWTATARHADIVLPCAAPQERTDFCGGHSDNALIPMPQLVPPPGEAISEFDIFAELEKRMGNHNTFSTNKSAQEWVRELWSETSEIARENGTTLPDWDTFISGDVVDLPDPAPHQVFLADFRADPDAHRLPTPSGRLELYSETIASFGYSDCPGHATWFEPRDVAEGKAAQFPLYLLSGQPETRLHSQLDNGDYSKSKKVKDREPVLIHPDDARERSIKDGDIVELFNQRGRCLAGAKVTDEVARGTVFLWTGAWYDPDFDAEAARDRHGNPNVLTHDRRTSRLTQGPAAHSALVEIRCFEGDLPPITVHAAPRFVSRG
ncbi:MAG TPA: molybdopterin dinucleotide binding domain-containing protein, partial [Xanthobacteraceae bacterium]|nr:molybdopterin dinucleotide binding domain-containing protein [Xanthobacteraceae bacterium]